MDLFIYALFLTSRLHFRDFLLHPCGDESEKEMLSVSQIALCCRHIHGDITQLAAALGISDEVIFKSKHGKIRDRAVQMLIQWQSSGTHTKQELTNILQNTGFERAADM